MSSSGLKITSTSSPFRARDPIFTFGVVAGALLDRPTAAVRGKASGSKRQGRNMPFADRAETENERRRRPGTGLIG